MTYVYAPVFREMDEDDVNLLSLSIEKGDPVECASGISGAFYYYSSSRDEFLIKSPNAVVLEAGWTEHTLTEAQADFPEAF